MPWATIADVQTITGVTVTQAVLDRSHLLVETLIDRTEAMIGNAAAFGTAEDYEGRPQDLRRLKTAVAWQAAHLTSAATPLAGQIGGVAAISQPDLSITFKDGADDLRRMFSPLVLSTLRKLSWRRNRSVPIASGATRSVFDPEDDDMHGERNQSHWVPIGWNR